MIVTKYYCDDCKLEYPKAEDLVGVEVRISGAGTCIPQCMRYEQGAHDHHRTDIKTVHLCKAVCFAKRNIAAFIGLARQ